jgi:hypothetical protein
MNLEGELKSPLTTDDVSDGLFLVETGRLMEHGAYNFKI